MGLSDGDGSSQFRQNVVVMRHGDRLDNVAPLWSASAPRPWDPPLADDGHLRAYATGDKLGKHLSFPIHRVFVSPFLRCLQTASGVVSALNKSDAVAINPSKIKVCMKNIPFIFDVDLLLFWFHSPFQYTIFCFINVLDVNYWILKYRISSVYCST